MAVENIFYARNVRSALKLGHARGVALLAASEAGLSRRRIRAGRDQARGRRLRSRGEAADPADGASCCSGSTRPPSPHDVADALAVAICHLHTSTGAVARADAIRRARSLAGGAAAILAASIRPVVIARLAGTLAREERQAV